MRLLENTHTHTYKKTDVDKDKDGEDILKLESVEVAQAKMIINTHQKVCLLFFQTNNLYS